MRKRGKGTSIQGTKFDWKRAWRTHSKLDATTRGVLSVVLKHCDTETIEAYPSIATIAAEIAVSKRTAQRCLAKAQEQGTRR